MQLADSKVFRSSRISARKKEVIVNVKLFKYVEVNIVIRNMSYTVIGRKEGKEIGLLKYDVKMWNSLSFVVLFFPLLN